MTTTRRSEKTMLTRLAHLIVRHRWTVIGMWIVLTAFGAVAAGQVSSRWYQSTSIPGQPAYEASQRSLHAFDIGDRSPSVVVFHTHGDATKTTAIKDAMARVAASMPGAFTSSYFTTGDLMYLSKDRHTAFQELYPNGPARLDLTTGANEIRATAAAGLPTGITVNVTGRDALDEASKDSSGKGANVLVEAVSGGIGALLILLVGFAVAAVLNTFTLVWGLTYLTDVSIIVQFLIALVGLGLGIDYALLMIFRFRDELR